MPLRFLTRALAALLLACPLAASAQSAPRFDKVLGTADGPPAGTPNAAPARHRWVTCAAQVKAEGRYGRVEYVIGGPWVARMPADFATTRAAAEESFMTRYLDEYASEVAKEYPGWELTPKNWNRCASAETYGELVGYSSLGRDLRNPNIKHSAFRPSFAR